MALRFRMHLFNHPEPMEEEKKIASQTEIGQRARPIARSILETHPTTMEILGRDFIDADRDGRLFNDKRSDVPATWGAEIAGAVSCCCRQKNCLPRSHGESHRLAAGLARVFLPQMKDRWERSDKCKCKKCISHAKRKAAKKKSLLKRILFAPLRLCVRPVFVF